MFLLNPRGRKQKCCQSMDKDKKYETDVLATFRKARTF